MTGKTSARRELLRAALRRCPNCGAGRLFSGYLRRAESCACCGTRFDGLDADDGPAWLTIGLTVPVLIASLIYLERSQDLPYFEEGLILIAVAVSCVLALLPVAKGFFIGLLWLSSRRGE